MYNLLVIPNLKTNPIKNFLCTLLCPYMYTIERPLIIPHTQLSRDTASCLLQTHYDRSQPISRDPRPPITRSQCITQPHLYSPCTHFSDHPTLVGALDGGPQCRLSISRKGNIPCRYFFKISYQFQHSPMSPLDVNK